MSERESLNPSLPSDAGVPFEDYPQDVLKLINRLAEALVRFQHVYALHLQSVQDDPKGTYLRLAREWDGLDLVAIQVKLAFAREAVELLTGDE